MKKTRWIFALVALTAALGAGCFGARSFQRSYLVMHGETREPIADDPLIRGLVRVRNMDTDAVYEKFQIVVRQSPYQLGYSDRYVWAVKPHTMVADLLAQAVEMARLFTAVTRDLGDARPKYTLSGQLHAIEVYDSGDLWFVHLELTLYLSRFIDGERVWTMDFDQRKRVIAGDYGHAARALSELLDVAVTQAIAELSGTDVAEGAPVFGPEPAAPRTDAPSDDDPVIIPDRRPSDRAGGGP